MACFIMGIDCGTTSVKVCLVDVKTREVSDVFTKDTLADVESDCGKLGNQQDPSRIYWSVISCMARISTNRLLRVVRVALCGQMHGVMFWNGDKAWTYSSSETDGSSGVRLDENKQYHTWFYTWQDGRCDSKFMSTLPAPKSHLKLATGYGCPAIFWFKRNRPDSFWSNFDRCGTVMDFIVAMITGNHSTPFMSTHNAASWGYYDCVANAWNIDILKENDFPIELLPRVVPPATDVGTLKWDWCGIPEGTPVSVALGDLQCSVLSALEDPASDVVLNISTSAQMAFVMPSYFQPLLSAATQRDSKGYVIEYLPYVGGYYLATVASLNGGNAIAAFVNMFQNWLLEFDFQVPQDSIWKKILMLAEFKASSSPETGCASILEQDSEELMNIIPRLYGERKAPDERGSASNICTTNLSLAQVTTSICLGVVKNIAEMMPPEVIHEAGMRRIVGTGSGLCRNPVLKAQVQKVYSLPVDFASTSSACIGSALAALDLPHTTFVNSH